MCGVLGIKDREASLENGESSCAEAGTTGEAYQPHATDEQYREAANQRQVPGVDFEEGAEVFSEGEMAPREDFRCELTASLSTFTVSVEECRIMMSWILLRPARSSRRSSTIVLQDRRNAWHIVGV